MKTKNSSAFCLILCLLLSIVSRVSAQSPASIKQGYSKANKTSRAFLHAVMDVGTLGAAEIIATPTECIFNGKNMAFEVSYDTSCKVNQVTQLDSKNYKQKIN